jgi:hypothetical protein
VGRCIAIEAARLRRARHGASSSGARICSGIETLSVKRLERERSDKRLTLGAWLLKRLIERLGGKLSGF